MLALGYGWVLIGLVRYALANEFNTYVLMIPPIAAFLYWLRPPAAARSVPQVAGAALGLAGFAILAGLSLWPGQTAAARLAWEVLSLPPLVAAWVLMFAGAEIFRAAAFPIALLFCMAPLPPPIVAVSENLLQHASACLAYVLFRLSDLPVLQVGSVDLQLPGITLWVAPACSGIQSTVALFVVSLAAGYVFIRSPWLRLVLTAAIFPLGILRNAIRIVTVGELCSHYGPQMLDSYIHRKGGWIFFLVFLVPFFALLLALTRFDRPSTHAK
jgi:exosortase